MDAAHWQFHRKTKHVAQLFGIDATATTDEHQLAALLQSEIRIQQLRHKLDTMREMAGPPPSTDTQVHAMGDVCDEAFTLDRGTNNSPRTQEPFSEARVEEILSKIEIGPDLTIEQHAKVRALICEYADIFALSLKEVLFVDWYTHKLNLEVENMHVVQHVPGEFIKALSSTNFAPKDVGKLSMTRTDILCQVNAECICNGLPSFWEEVMLPGETDKALLDTVENDETNAKKTKWRVCHPFNVINKLTQVPPFLAGDLKAKQEFAAGHRWASIIDFAAGYSAVPLDDKSVPCMVFYMEGRGYYVYLCMPFGLTGAPATFCEMVAIALNDMIGKELVNWMDNICLPGDIFETKLANLQHFFNRC